MPEEKDDNGLKHYTLNQEHVDAAKKRLDELVGKKIKLDDNIFAGIESGIEGGETAWSIGGYYKTTA